MEQLGRGAGEDGRRCSWGRDRRSRAAEDGQGRRLRVERGLAGGAPGRAGRDRRRERRWKDHAARGARGSAGGSGTGVVRRCRPLRQPRCLSRPARIRAAGRHHPRGAAARADAPVRGEAAASGVRLQGRGRRPRRGRAPGARAHGARRRARGSALRRAAQAGKLRRRAADAVARLLPRRADVRWRAARSCCASCETSPPARRSPSRRTRLRTSAAAIASSSWPRRPSRVCRNTRGGAPLLRRRADRGGLRAAGHANAGGVGAALRRPPWRRRGGHPDRGFAGASSSALGPASCGSGRC